MLKNSRIFGVLNYRLMAAGFWLLVCLMAGSAVASLSSTYKTDQSLEPGIIVSLADRSSDKVVPADTQRIALLLGVVVDQKLAQSQPGTVEVAISGVASVLVSNVNGDIRAGDQITASSIEGVGVRATTPGSKILGIAQADFNDRSSGRSSAQIKGQQNQTQTVSIGMIPVLLSITDFNLAQAYNKSTLPSPIQGVKTTGNSSPLAACKVIKVTASASVE